MCIFCPSMHPKITAGHRTGKFVPNTAPNTWHGLWVIIVSIPWSLALEIGLVRFTTYKSVSWIWYNECLNAVRIQCNRRFSFWIRTNNNASLSLTIITSGHLFLSSFWTTVSLLLSRLPEHVLHSVRLTSIILKLSFFEHEMCYLCSHDLFLLPLFSPYTDALDVFQLHHNWNRNRHMIKECTRKYMCLFQNSASLPLYVALTDATHVLSHRLQHITQQECEYDHSLKHDIKSSSLNETLRLGRRGVQTCNRVVQRASANQWERPKTHRLWCLQEFGYTQRLLSA